MCSSVVNSRLIYPLFIEGCLGPSYPRLARFIKAAAANGSHTTRTVFGPNASFFSTSPSGFCWQNLPPGLEDNMQSCIRLRRPICIALGVEGTYVVVYSDGTTAFDLCGQYPLLQTIIMETAPSKRGLAVGTPRDPKSSADLFLPIFSVRCVESIRGRRILCGVRRWHSDVVFTPSVEP